MAADPLRPQDHRLHRLASHPDSRRLPHRRVFPGRGRRDRDAGGDHRRSPGRAGRGRRDRPGGRGYEPDEDEKVTAAVIEKALKELIDDLKDASGASAKQELKKLTDQETIIKAIQRRVAEAKAALNEKSAELEFKLELKRVGADDFKAEIRELLKQADARIAELDPKSRADKKTILALNKDKEALNIRLARTDAVLKAIGGQISEEDARRLILKKIYDIARGELNRYLNAEKQVLVRAVENLWKKYAVSADSLESRRGAAAATLGTFVVGLGYRQ